MSVKLILTMETSNGDKNFTYNYVNDEPTVAQVKAACTALVTNGNIFENVPTAAKAAKLVTTTEELYDLS